MKLAFLALAGLLGLGSLAHADPDGLRHRRGGGPRGQVRQALLERFDHNHDGRLEPRERAQAIRALRHLTRRLARQQQGAMGRIRGERRVIERFDANGDGAVGPNEVPPGVADRMRHLDHNRDGWVDDADQ